MAKIPSYLLNLAGEYRICSELNKRGVFATVTYGTRKGADVYAISDRRSRALKIEVKTSQGTNFVTSLSQKSGGDDPNAPDFWERRANDPEAPDFWVLFQIKVGKDAKFGERFFILSHQEICGIQSTRNAAYATKYHARHGKNPDFSKGVDNVTVEDVTSFEDQWAKIIERLGGTA
jgi:hypothetical protein